MSEIKKDCTDPQIDLEISVFFFHWDFTFCSRLRLPLISGNRGMMGRIGVGKSHEAKQHFQSNPGTSFSGPEVIQRVEF